MRKRSNPHGTYKSEGFKNRRKSSEGNEARGNLSIPTLVQTPTYMRREILDVDEHDTYYEKTFKSPMKDYNPRDGNEAEGCYIKNMDLRKQKQKRSGFIIYSVVDDKIIYGMGIDSNSGEITDFGGGVESDDKNVICAGLREFTEETLLSFGILDEKDTSEFFSIYSDSVMITFAHLDFNMDEVTKHFDSERIKVKETGKIEVDRLVWMTHDELTKCVRTNSPKMYERVRRLINNFIVKKGDLLQYL